MAWTELHAEILGSAFSKVLGAADPGSMAFVRCLTSDVVRAIAHDMAFAPKGWQVCRVADTDEGQSARTVTADRAVELREAKGDAVLLLVDTARAGAGMDGIYSAAREINELTLFTEALRLAASEVTRRLTRGTREHAELSLKKARGYGRRFSISLWTEFDFLVRIAAEKRLPGDLLYLLGLWPVAPSDDARAEASLDVSRMFVDRLLGTAVSGLPPARRIEGLKLLSPSEQQLRDLELFLRTAAMKPLVPALADLADKKNLWVNAIKVEEAIKAIQSIELLPWRTNTGAVARWSLD